MFRYACFTLSLLLVIGIHQSCSIEVNVTNADKKLCLYAELMVNFTVTYEVDGKVNNTVTFALPDKVSSTGSTCGNDSSTMKLEFGEGHSWTVNFTRDNKTYKADSIVFIYNLSDSVIFRNSSSNKTVMVLFPLKMDEVGLDTYYSCRSNMNLTAGLVTQILWNISLQAFIPNGTLSNNATVCTADIPTTPVPTTQTTTSTVPTSTPTPTPVPQPGIGNYSVTENNTVCLMATLGLQMHYNDGSAFQVMNLDPNKTISGGKCQGNSSEASLHLTSEKVSIMFTFTEDGKKFILHAVAVNVTKDNDTIKVSNTNMSLWETWLGSSYMCNKQQTFNITDSFAILTYELQVQPFNVKDNKYATAHECSMDDSSILIPIVVGAALAGLIVIVLIAYVIGRRKTYVGYQTL